MTSDRKPGPDGSGWLHTGGALEGGLWEDLSQEGSTRSTSSASDSRGDARPGATPRQIGAYRIVGLLGSGGMGEVFLGFDDRLQRHVAIKRIRRAKQMSERAKERLRREAAAAAALNHAAVIHIYDILDEPSGQAIVMEFADGYTLAQMLAAGRLPAHRAVSIARQVAEGLAAAHAVGLIHRDLKTQNVMVTPSGQAKILDFGLAKRLTPPAEEDALTAEGHLLGTVRAMSPEQARGAALDPRSDLFSLGVLLYEICTGRSPFEGSGPVQTLRNVIDEPPASLAELNPDLPDPLVTLVQELLEKDPARRPASAASVAERLAEIERLPALRALELPSGRGPRVAPVPLSGQQAFALEPAAAVGDTRPAHSARRWRWVAAAGVGALVAALAVARVRRESAPVRRLAVVVQEPRIAVSAPDEHSRFAAFAVREAANQVLTGLAGIDLIGSEEVAEAGVPPQGAPRVVAADEVVGATIACEGQWCRVSLRRQAVDGRIVADSGSFDVSSASEDSLALANAVGIHLRKVYGDHPPRTPEERLDVRSEDYSRFLVLARANEAGQVLGRTAIDELEQLARSSPGLTEAPVLAVGAARRFLRDPARADEMLREAEARHPADPRLVFERFLLRLDAGQFGAAETAVAELERLAPGAIRVSRARALLLIGQGRLAEAAEVRRRMVRERPSWRNLWYLANLEIDLADEPAARQHLDQLLALSPGNRRGLEKKAELEWLMGDPAAAARIYEELLRKEVTLFTLTNLGWSLLLSGDYAGSISANHRALDLEAQDDDMLSQLNLGIAYEGAGDPEAARRLYRGLLERLASADGRAGLDRQLLQAQALARLGRCVEAITVSKKALEDGKPRAQGVFKAAVIHALCREENAAIVYAREARKRGLSARWFGIPGFESLHSRPEFRELVSPSASGPPASRGASQ